MATCVNCGAIIPGKSADCPACGICQGTPPANPPPPPADPSAVVPLTGLRDIERKIGAGRFRRNELRRWGWWGALAGTTVGSFFVVADFVQYVLNGRGLNPFGLGIDVVIAPYIFVILLFAVIGWVAALLLVGVVKPVVLAIFWDVKRYEREYGSTRTRPLSPPEDES
jgi:hypothetical protein